MPKPKPKHDGRHFDAYHVIPIETIDDRTYKTCVRYIWFVSAKYHGTTVVRQSKLQYTTEFGALYGLHRRILRCRILVPEAVEYEIYRRAKRLKRQRYNENVRKRRLTHR